MDRPEAFSSESELYFDVWERPAYFIGGAKQNSNLLDLVEGQNIKDSHPNYYQDADHKHIVRLWNGKPISIGVVGKNYKLLKNRELCESIEDIFMESLTEEELHGVTRTDNISYMGGTCIRDYIFPAITADIGSQSSTIAFRVIIVNGYDGSSSFKFYHGAIDFFCTNGMVSGSYDMIMRKHTSGLVVPKLTDKLRKSIDIFYKQADQWKHWVGKEISDEQAEEVFKAMPNISERRVNQLMRQFRIEVQTHGPTVWALYSAATYYASSNEGEFAVRETNSDHKASTLLNREQQVRSWLNTDEFQEISNTEG